MRSSLDRATLVKTLAAAMVVALFPLIAQAAEKPLIRWVASPWAPNWITEGPLKGSGYGDRMQKLVQEALPGFSHETRWSSAPRLARVMASSRRRRQLRASRRARR